MNKKTYETPEMATRLVAMGAIANLDEDMSDDDNILESDIDWT